ncbi:HGGxSTG domain-containing protein [Thetidibacter halocola]|uniref:HGGxSTG domain-containing protein n=1 Tax=Thetidibacter halocola TaxID=2827239 RepID=UPI003D1619EE
MCGARTRKGTPCRAKSEPGKRRCRFHGGCSTGPRTPEGRERIAEAQRRRWAAWRAAQKPSTASEREAI